MNRGALTQRVNFSLSVILLGSAALLGIVLMLDAAEMDNPIARHLMVIAEEM